MELKQILTDIARAIVDSPEQVSVTVNETETSINLTLSVAPEDMGMVIGKGGRIAKAIVDNPDAVVVEEEINGDNVEFTLSVAEDDTGMVIGRHGRIAKAIRQVMKAAANTCGKHVTVEIK